MNIGKEMQKAETKLKLIERQREASHGLVEKRYDTKRDEFIAGLHIQVRAALRYARVIDAELPSPDVETP